MKDVVKGRSQRYAMLATVLGLSLAASGGIAGAAEGTGDPGVSAGGGKAGTSALNRYELANQILDRWQAIAVELGQNAGTWRETFSTQLALMPVSDLDTLAAVKADGGTAKASYEAFKQAFRNAMMQAHVQAQAQATKGPAKLGSLSSDQVFIPIVPCRVVDTRNVGGPINAGTTRNFFFYTQGASGDWSSQGGPAGPAGTTCPGTINPNGSAAGGSPSAAAATITVVAPTAAGNFVAWSGASPVSPTSALNWTNAGDVVANTTIIPAGHRSGTGPGGAIGDFAVAYNGSSGSAHVVVDVVGYFVENTVTALDCTQINSGDITIPNNTSISADATCPLGYTLTGGGFLINEGSGGVINDWLWTSYPASATTWRTNWSNQTGASRNGRTYAVCCRIPGR